MAEAAKWYVVHTYSGYENTVKATIEKTVESRHLQDVILSVSIPLTEDEVYAMGVEKKEIIVSYNVGDTVRILDGPLSSFTGTVESIEIDKNAVNVIVSMFGRETSVEFELDQVEVVSQ